MRGVTETTNTETTTTLQESDVDADYWLIEQYELRDEQERENLSLVLRSIVEGDCEALASVTHFPIWRPYPEKDIENADELKSLFPILFDDSIKCMLKDYTYEDWKTCGWRGFTLDRGQYLWTDTLGLLHYVTYQSEQLKALREQLTKEEYQDLNESENWITHDCLLSEDSTLFLRLEKMDGVERLHVLTREEHPYLRHFTFNGTMEIQGSCRNEVYWYVCKDSIITVWINSPRCSDAPTPYAIDLPSTMWPEYGNIIRCKRAYWREVKTWW